jgi:hypothetical protein
MWICRLLAISSSCLRHPNVPPRVWIIGQTQRAFRQGEQEDDGTCVNRTGARRGHSGGDQAQHLHRVDADRTRHLDKLDDVESPFTAFIFGDE